MILRLRILALGLFALATFSSLAHATANPIVRFNTSFGNIDVILYEDKTPLTVANFLAYVNSGAYTNNIIHRSIPGFVIQGGVIDLESSGLSYITPNAPVADEHFYSNTRGTIAMALPSTGPGNATCSWFFNTVDNSATLDGTVPDGGPFTVFGVVANSASLAVMDEIAAVPVPSPSPFASNSQLSALFANIPLVNYVAANGVTASNLVFVNSITVLVHPSFFTGETQLPNSDLYYLQFPNNTVFGYYNDNSFPIIYHFNLGYEYVYDAGNGGVYFFDYHSGHFWYTNPTSYPFLYDFSLHTYLYYYDGNGSPRYFFNYATNKVITE